MASRLGDRSVIIFWRIHLSSLANIIPLHSSSTASSGLCWELIPNTDHIQPPAARYGHSAVAYRDSWIIFGGTGISNLCNDVWAFSFASSKWGHIPCTGAHPSPRTNHSATIFGNKLVIYGGYDASGALIKDLHVLDLKCMCWFLPAHLPSIRPSWLQITFNTSLPLVFLVCTNGTDTQFRPDYRCVGWITLYFWRRITMPRQDQRHIVLSHPGHTQPLPFCGSISPSPHHDLLCPWYLASPFAGWIPSQQHHVCTHSPHLSSHISPNLLPPFPRFNAVMEGE